MGKMATSPLPYRGSPPLQSGGQNQEWPTSGQSGYLTPAVSGIPSASERGAKSEVAHKWAKWLPHPCRIGDPHRFRAGGKIRSGPQVGKVATSPLPYRGSPPLQSGGQNQKWPTSGQSGYLTPATSGIPTASERGAKSEVAHKWAKLATSPLPYRGSPPLQSGGQFQKWPTSGQNGYLTPAVSGIPTATEQGAKSEVAHKWAKWLPHPCRIRDPLRFRGGGKIRSGPQVGKMATSPLPYRGSPPLQSGGQNQKWPTSGQSGYLTPAASGIPSASERGAKSEVAHKWAKWLPHPCRIGDPHRFRVGGKIRSGPQVGKVATSPLPYRGSPPLQSGGAKSEVAHKWANRLPHPCRIGDPLRFRAGGKIRSGPQVGKVATSPLPYRGSPPLQRRGGKIRSGPQVGKMATSPLPYRGSPPLQSGGQNQKWPTSGQSGYLTPAVSGSPTAAERGGKIRSGPQVGKPATSPLPYRGSPPLQSRGQNQKWPTSGQSGYLTPAVSGIPTASERGGKIRSGPQVGKMATSPLPYRGSPPLQSRGQNQKWPTSGQNGYLTPAVSGIPSASEQGAKSEVAHKWAKWLPHPCRTGDPHRCRAGGKIRSGPQVGKVATSPLPYRGSPPLQSGGQNQKWPTRGQNGYLTPAVSGIPTASERGGKSEVAHKWANRLPHPCRIGEPHRFRAGGQNQKWPTSGQSGYLTPAVSGIPTASERGAKSEVAHKWAKWLPHPCRIGDPHRFRAGGKIRSGPQVGKMATSPLPYRGSPPLQSGGANSEVAHKWAKWLPHPCRIGDPLRFRAGGKIRSGPQVGKMATSPLPYRGSPPLQSGGQNQKWPTSGQNGYLTPAVSGIPTASERGGKIRSGPQVGKVATSPLPYRGSPPLQSGGQNQKWCPKEGRNRCVTPAVSAIPKRGGGVDMAHVRPGQTASRGFP